MEEHNVKIYLGNELASLYELGWISSDLSQLIEFSDLLADENIVRAEKFFGDKARPFNRYTKLNGKQSKKPEIYDVKKGSVELNVAIAGVCATVVMALVQIAVQRYFSNRDEVVTFNISSEDGRLQRILTSYSNGDFGRGVDGLNALFALLQQTNYDVQALSNNTFLVEHVVNKYSQRIVKTIKKNR